MNNTLEIILIVLIGLILFHFYGDIFRLRKDNKKLRRLAKVKSEFIAMTVHQLRTPLAKVKWILHSVIKEDTGPLNEEQKDILESGYHANEKMVNLLNDLLDMSRTEDAGLGYNFKKSPIENVAVGLIKSFSLMAKQKNIDLALSMPEEPIPEIMMDSRKIGLALGNLIDNALQYTPEGGKVLVNLEKSCDCVKISVKDSGIGIPEEERNKIFTQFFRARNAKSAREDGTGLGLYIVKNIVKIHGGDVWFESEEGKGTTFYFTIPFRTEGEIKKDVEKFVKSI